MGSIDVILYCKSELIANLGGTTEVIPFVLLWMKGIFSVPSMGNNLVVKAHYGLGSRNR